MKSISEIISSKCGPRSPRCMQDGMSYRVYKSGNKNRMACVFVLGSGVVRDMRWMAGDRIDVLFDAASKCGKLVRVTSGGWALSVGGGSKSEKASHTVRVGFYKETGLPESTSPISYQVSTDGVFFSFNTQAETPAQ